MGEGRKETLGVRMHISYFIQFRATKFYLTSSAYLLSCILHAVSVAIFNLLCYISYKHF